MDSMSLAEEQGHFRWQAMRLAELSRAVHGNCSVTEKATVQLELILIDQ